MDFFAFDDEYVRRLREGDRWTEEHFAAYFGDLLTLKLRRSLRSNSDIEDVVQEVLLRAFQGIKSGTVRDGHKLGAFVFGICRNYLQEFQRKHPHTEELPPDIPSPDDLLRELIKKETKERVHRTLESMGKREADILRATFIHEGDKDVICKKYGVDRNYLRVLVHRALKKFRDEYDDPDDS